MSEMLHLKMLQSDITSEHLKRVYDMALFERDAKLGIDNEDIQALKRLHDMIGLLAEFEIDFESKMEDLNG